MAIGLQEILQPYSLQLPAPLIGPWCVHHSCVLLLYVTLTHRPKTNASPGLCHSLPAYHLQLLPSISSCYAIPLHQLCQILAGILCQCCHSVPGTDPGLFGLYEGQVMS